MSTRPVIGQYAPLPRPTARRLSDIHPYATMAGSYRRDPDRWVGVGLAFVAVAAVLLMLFDLA